METDVFHAGPGWAAVAVTDRGVRAVVFGQPSRGEALAALERQLPGGGEGGASGIRPAAAGRSSGLLAAVRDAITRYMEGRRVEFPFPLDLSGFTPFQRQVLEVARKIPYGEARPYGWVAQAAGSPGAARAVGQVMHINPVPPIVPCHRVVAAGGRLGGYGGHLGTKVRLLEMEGLRVSGLVVRGTGRGDGP